MMIRELVVNAIEAASQATTDKRVDITSIDIDGTAKLCIRNTGRGMSAVELDRICDLASSLYKQNSLDGNFGMGAKVASLPSNKHGLRYRSCKDGTVSQVILCQRDGIYGRLRVPDANGQLAELIDATATCRTEGDYDLTSDWTQVVLFGNTASQNTVTDPYAANPKMDPDWLVQNLLLRFFRIPPGVDVTLSSDVLRGTPARRMQTLADLVTAADQAETVRTPSGIVIHYRYDPAADTNPSSLAPIIHPAGQGCIVFKDEIYDPRTGTRWGLDAPTYGIPFGAKFCSVFVELPDDYLVRPEAYRQFLRFRGGDQRQVFLHDFGQLVTAYMPDWLRTVIRSHGPQQAKFVGDVEDELRDLVQELEIDPEFKPPAPPAKPQAANPPPKPPAQDGTADKPASDDPVNQAEPAEKKTPPKPAVPPPPPPRKYERPPEIIGLDSDELIEERGLKGRAAKFYQTSHQLFVNLNYPAVRAVATQLQAEFDIASDGEQARGIALGVAGWAVTRRIARALVYSLSKKAAGWPAEDVKRAQSPESFSLVADDWSSVMELARKRMEEALGPDWQPAQLADAA
jgi:hypothetical protein